MFFSSHGAGRGIANFNSESTWKQAASGCGRKKIQGKSIPAVQLKQKENKRATVAPALAEYEGFCKPEPEGNIATEQELATSRGC